MRKYELLKRRVIQHISVVLLVSVCALGTACGHDTTGELPAPSNTVVLPDDITDIPNVTDIPEIKEDNVEKNPKEEKQESSADSDVKNPTEAVKPDEGAESGTPEAQPEDDKKEDIESTEQTAESQSGEDDISADIQQTIPEDDPDDGEGEDVTSASDFGKKEAWEQSFLIWVPVFEYGEFGELTSEEMFDYAHFDNVSAKEAKEYKSLVIEKGFTDVIDDVEDDDNFVYRADGTDGWIVSIEYADGKATIGAGFVDEEDESDVSTIWRSTKLMYLPEFNAGELKNYYDENGYDFATFENVTEEDVRAYFEQVDAQGFTYDKDCGDMDGMMWYFAMNEVNLYCDIQYSDGYLIIGCGEEEE